MNKQHRQRNGKQERQRQRQQRKRQSAAEVFLRDFFRVFQNGFIRFVEVPVFLQRIEDSRLPALCLRIKYKDPVWIKLRFSKSQTFCKRTVVKQNNAIYLPKYVIDRDPAASNMKVG